MREEGGQLGVRRKLDQPLRDLRAEDSARLPHLKQSRNVPQRRGGLAREHRDHRVAQVAVGAAANLAVAEQAPQRGDDLIGDRVGRRVHGERVEAGARRRHVEHRADARARDDAEYSFRGVALGVEHDHGAVLPQQIRACACDEQ